MAITDFHYPVVLVMKEKHAYRAYSAPTEAALLAAAVKIVQERDDEGSWYKQSPHITAPDVAWRFLSARRRGEYEGFSVVLDERPETLVEPGDDLRDLLSAATRALAGLRGQVQQVTLDKADDLIRDVWDLVQGGGDPLIDEVEP